MILQPRIAPFASISLSNLGSRNAKSSNSIFDQMLRHVDRIDAVKRKHIESFVTNELSFSDNGGNWVATNASSVSLNETTSTTILQFGATERATVEMVESNDGKGVALRMRLGSKVPILMFFERNGRNLVLSSRGDKLFHLPDDSLGLIALFFPTLFYSFERAKANRNRLRKDKRSESINEVACGDRDPNNGKFNFSHDYACNLPEPATNLVTKDGRFYMWINCFLFKTQEIEIDTLSCCKQHDIDLWCSVSNLEAMGADEKVVACFAAATLDQGLAKIDPACGVIWGGYAQLLAQVAVFFVLTEIFVASWANLIHDSDLIGYGGRNKDSCLCGGDVPTALCDNPCRDVCAEAGKASDCSHCTWKCSYNIETGKATGYRHVGNANGNLCCPGTQESCMPPISEIKKRCPDREKGCFDCEYYCDVCEVYHWKFCPNPGVKTLRLRKADDLPCCNGTPKSVSGDFCKNIDVKTSKPFA